MIPDDLWAKIYPRGQALNRLICGPCIMERIEGQGQFGAYRLTEL